VRRISAFTVSSDASAAGVSRAEGRAVRNEPFVDAVACARVGCGVVGEVGEAGVGELGEVGEGGVCTCADCCDCGVETSVGAYCDGSRLKAGRFGVDTEREAGFLAATFPIIFGFPGGEEETGEEERGAETAEGVGVSETGGEGAPVDEGDGGRAERVGGVAALGEGGEPLGGVGRGFGGEPLGGEGRGFGGEPLGRAVGGVFG
jgi:hypothetical protein